MKKCNFSGNKNLLMMYPWMLERKSNDTGRPPFICPNNCGRKYKYKQGLQRHFQFECGKEPQFQCNVCFKKFSQSTSLKAHYGIIHKLIVNNNSKQ